MERPPPPSPPPLDEARIQDDRANVREPFFHGREAEFKMFRAAAHNLVDDGPGDLTLVYQGPPGVGKSALMEEIIATVRHHAWATGEPWIAVRLLPDELPDSGTVCHRIIEVFMAENNVGIKNRINALKRGVDVSVTLPKFLTFGAKVTVKPRTDLDIPRIVNKNLSRLVEFIGDTRVVLCVDEASGMVTNPKAEDARTESVRAILKRFHMPNPRLGLHIQPVFFGLSNTIDVLVDLQLSRLTGDNVTTLARLNDSDARAVLDDVCNTYGIELEPSDSGQFIERLIDAGQGWPQHLKIVTKALLNNIPDMGQPFTREDMSKILANIEKFKSGYYTRIQQRMDFAYPVLEEVAKRCAKQGSITKQQLDALLKKKGIDRGEFLKQALRSGFLAPHGAEGYVIPIPSLQTDILGTADKAREQDTGR